MVSGLYGLIAKVEGCSKAKFNHVIDNDYVNCDVGEVTTDKENEEVFDVKFTSLVIPKSNLKDYTEEVDDD